MASTNFNAKTRAMVIVLLGLVSVRHLFIYRQIINSHSSSAGVDGDSTTTNQIGVMDDTNADTEAVAGGGGLIPLSRRGHMAMLTQMSLLSKGRNMVMAF